MAALSEAVGYDAWRGWNGMNKITLRGPECHVLGSNSFHAAQSTWEETNGLDTDYLSVVADALAGELNGADMTDPTPYPRSSRPDHAHILTGWRVRRRRWMPLIASGSRRIPPSSKARTHLGFGARPSVKGLRVFNASNRDFWRSTAIDDFSIACTTPVTTWKRDNRPQE